MASPLRLLLPLLALGCASAPAPTPPAPLPAPAPQVRSPTLRLGGDVRPERYAVELTVDPAEETFEGQVEVALQLGAPTGVLWLNGVELTVHEASLQVGAETVAARPVAGEPGFLGFVLARPVGPGPAVLRVRYTGQATARDSTGVFRQKEGGVWYAFTQFEPVDARRAFPCFDEPGHKVPWQLTLRVPAAHEAFSNTPVQSEETGADGWKTVRFAPTPPLPSYLVAFGVGPFDVVDAGVAGQKRTPVRILVPHGRGKEAAWAVEATAPLLAELERFFGTPYPFEKLDLLDIPLATNFGAMEHPGLVTFVSDVLLARPEEDTEARRRELALTVAHELAHQWFGNLVTPAWWDDLWLNESFASWLETKVVEAWQPGWDMPLARVHAQAEAMARDGLLSAPRIRRDIAGVGDIESAFDFITYQKGSAVLSMLEAHVGADVFRQGVRAYLARHAHGTATAADFVAALSEAAGRDMGPLVRAFTEQPGVPLLRVALACEAGTRPTLHLSQERFLPVGQRAPTAQVWRLPVCVRSGEGRTSHRACTVLEGPEGALPLPGARTCPAWVAPNAEAQGYYRSHLEGDLLARLTPRGASPLSRAEQVALLEDAHAQMRAGTLPAGDALALLSRLLPSEDRHVLSAAAGLVAGIPEDLLTPALRPRLARFVRRTLGARARALGLTPSPGESEEVRLLRPVLAWVVAEVGEDRALRAQARSLATRALTEPEAVAPEMLRTVLRLAALEGDAALHAAMLEAARKEEGPRRRRLLLAGLGGFRTKALVERNLALLLSDAFDTREAMELAFAAAEHPDTREQAFAFTRAHYDALLSRFPRESASALIGLGAGFCDGDHRQEVEAFFRERAAGVSGGPQALAESLEQVDLCIALKQAQGASLAHFLSRE